MARPTRAQTERKKHYKQPMATDMPAPPAGTEYRLCRNSIHGQADDQNMVRHLREGWVPVKPEELKGSDMFLLEGSWRGHETVTAGSDLVLMKNSTDKVQFLNEQVVQRTRNQDLAASQAQKFRSQMADPRYGRLINVTDRGNVQVSTDDERDYDDNETERE